MILHIPHSGVNTLGRQISQHDINRGTDWFTDELFWHENSDRVVQSVSRFVCDCERLQDNIEPLYSKGYGIQYTKDFDGGDIITYGYDYIHSLYNEHHRQLNFLTRKTLTYIDTVFVVDCHSFGYHQIESDIDFCIGFNDDFVDYDLLSDITEFVQSQGYKVGVNAPYSNAITPSQYQNNPKVKNIMIEVNKRNYLNEDFTKSTNFDNLQTTINEILNLISKKEQEYDII